MARGRAQLSEKEERILIQAQLMGLDTSSMVRIGNRLRALDKEREDMETISAATRGVSWTRPADTSNWVLTSDNGKVYNCEYKTKDTRGWSGYKVVWNITITKPGTRYKDRVLEKQEVWVNTDFPKRMLPEKSRDLFALIQAVTRGKFD